MARLNHLADHRTNVGHTTRPWSVSSRSTCDFGRWSSGFLTTPDDSGHRFLTYTAQPGGTACAALARLKGSRRVLTP